MQAINSERVQMSKENIEQHGNNRKIHITSEHLTYTGQLNINY